MIKRHSTQLVALASSLLLAQMLPAQTTPATDASKPADTDSDIVRLSEFSVSTDRDYGYRASNSISGTRIDTPIRDIPMNIQVFTKDLVEDLHITNTVDLEAYDASVTNGGPDRNTSTVIQQAYQDFIFRGFRQNWALRDGIREYDPVDSQNLSRVEYVKGPAAALYGLAYPGGVQQNITKEADLSKNYTELRASYGSYGEYRGTLDSNLQGDLGGHRVAIRVNLADGRSKDERAHSEGIQQLQAVTATYLVTPTTKVQGFIEHAYRGIPNGLGYFQEGEAGAVGNNASIPLQIIHPNIPWTWNWSNGRNLQDIDTKLYRAAATQSIGDNFTVTGYVQYSTRLNITGNGWDANGSGGGDSWESPNSGWLNIGQPNEEIASTYHYRDWGNQMHAYGATGIYKLDVNAGAIGKVKNTFVFGGAAWGEKELTRASGTNDQAQIIYAIASGIPINVPSVIPSTVTPDNADAGSSGYHHENNSNDYYFANWQSSWFEDRLHILLGGNHTSMKLLQWNDGAEPAPNIRYTASKFSPLISASYDITKEISIYALHSTSLFPDTTKDSFGNNFSPQVGSSKEIGIKTEAFDGKISGTISVYEIKQTGGTQNDPGHFNYNVSLWDSETPAQRAAQFPNQTRESLLAVGDIIAGGLQKSTGVEADLILQPIREWQVRLSLAHNHHEFVTSADPTTIGETYPFHVSNTAAMVTKYTFADGAVKGLAVGAGVHYNDKTLQNYVPWGGQQVARYEPSRTTAELFGEYKYKVYGYNTTWQLNVKNLLGTSDYVGWQATGSSSVLSTTMYKVPLPTTYTLTVGLDF